MARESGCFQGVTGSGRGGQVTPRKRLREAVSAGPIKMELNDLAQSVDPQRPIHISAASVLDEALGLRHYIVPNGFLTLDRD